MVRSDSIGSTLERSSSRKESALKKRIEGVTVYGIDIGKNTIHAVALDSSGKPVLHSRFRRDRLLVHFANTPAALIGMESCPGSPVKFREL